MRQGAGAKAGTGRRRVAVAILGGALLALGPGSRPRAEDTTADVLHAAALYAGLLRDAMPILERHPDAATLRGLLFDARHAAAEVDRLSANAAIYGASTRDRQSLQDLTAAAHLRLALFETRALEFDRGRQEIARARSLSDRLEDPAFRIEWAALQDGAPGAALVTRYHLLKLGEFEAALGSAWSRSRSVSFEFHGYGAETLLAADLVRSPEPDPGSLEELLVSRGAAILRQALDQGKRSATAPLPAGAYRFRAASGGDLDRSFIVPEVSEVDPVVVDRARFTLDVDPKPGIHGPRFFLNGFEVTDLTTMPYGAYRVKVDADYFPDAPEMVRFIMGDGVPDKSRASWTIYVPGGGSARFRLDRSPLGTRLLRR